MTANREPWPALDLRADLHGHATEYASDNDRAWFELHPSETVRYRPAVEHEFCDPQKAPDCVPLLTLPSEFELWVEVRRLDPGARLRAPYGVPRGVDG